jgi:predicted PurR-regulated permease PerM
MEESSGKGMNEQGQPARRDRPSDLRLPSHRADKFARYSLLLIVLATSVVFLNMIKAFLVPVILASVNAGLFFSFYSWLLKRTRGRKALSAFVCCATLSLGLLLPAYAAANLVSREALRLYQSAGPRAREFFERDVGETMQAHPLIRKLHLENVPLRPTFEHLAQKGSELLANAINVASRETFDLISTLFITFFTMFYFFRDGPQLLAKLKYLSPLAEVYEEELIRRFLSVSRATLKGTLLVALIKGILGGLTFWAFGIEAPVLWGVVMVFLSVLPIVGPWLVMYPAALVLLLGGQVWQGITLFLIATFVVGLVDNVLEPIVIGRDSGMHDLMVFFSMLGGIGMFGVMGFLVGPVIAALFLTLLEIYGKEFSKQLTFVHNRPNAETPGTASHLSQD